MLRHILLASAATFAAAPAFAQSADSAAISGLGIRNVGSATMSGRIAALDGRQDKDGKVTLLIGSASGGVWKSEDGGTTFKPVFDKQPVESIGDVAIDPTNPKVMWVGSGESWSEGHPTERQRVIIASGEANPPVTAALFEEPRGPGTPAKASGDPPDASNKAKRKPAGEEPTEQTTPPSNPSKGE